jgi:hypothetical protein
MEFFNSGLGGNILSHGGAGDTFRDPEDADFESFMMAQFQAKIHFYWQFTGGCSSSSSVENTTQSPIDTSVIISGHRLCSMLIQDYLFFESSNEHNHWTELAKIVGQTMVEGNQKGALTSTDGIKTHYFSVFVRNYSGNDGNVRRVLWIKAVKDFAFVREHWASLIECLLLEHSSININSSFNPMILKEVLLLHVHEESHAGGGGGGMFDDESSSMQQSMDTATLFQHSGNSLNDSSMDTSVISPLIHHMKQSLLTHVPLWSTSTAVSRMRRQVPNVLPSAVLVEPVRSLIEICEERSIPIVALMLPFIQYDLQHTKVAVEQVVGSLKSCLNPDDNNFKEQQQQQKSLFDRWKRLVLASSSHLYS